MSLWHQEIRWKPVKLQRFIVSEWTARCRVITRAQGELGRRWDEHFSLFFFSGDKNKFSMNMFRKMNIFEPDPQTPRAAVPILCCFGLWLWIAGAPRHIHVMLMTILLLWWCQSTAVKYFKDCSTNTYLKDKFVLSNNIDCGVNSAFILW